MDVLHDNSLRTWVQLGDAHESLIPQYVMQYNLPDKEAASKMEDGLFADDARRLFPVDSKEATWLSAAYFAKNAEKLPYDAPERMYVEEIIKDAAAAYDIEEDVTAIMNAVQTSELEKSAEDDDSNYGWIMIDEKTGEVLARKYPMFDGRGVKLASTYFDENRNHYPLGIRRAIARRIMSKAADYGMDTDELSPSVLKEAGFGIPRKDVLMQEILERAHLTKDAQAAILLANVNELIAGLSDREIGGNLDKIAEVIDAFDHGADLTRYYGTRILMPSDFLFDVNLKTAQAAVEDAVELDKYLFSLDKLAELPLRVYEDVLGDDFAQAIIKTGEENAQVIDKAKLADNLFSLPRPDKAALEEHLAELFA